MKKLLFLLLTMQPIILAAQDHSSGQGKYPPPVQFTREQDHQNMMDQLGIKALRPGPASNPDAPNHANYDEELANPFPDLPDILTILILLF